MDQPRELRELPAAAPQSRPRPGPKPLHIHSRERRRQEHWRNERVSSPAYQLSQELGTILHLEANAARVPNCGSLLQQGGLTLASFRQQCPETSCTRPTRSRAVEARRRAGVFDTSACKKVSRCGRHRYQQQPCDQDPLPHHCDVHLDTMLTECHNVMLVRRWSDDEFLELAQETESPACMRCRSVRRVGCAIDHETDALAP